MRNFLSNFGGVIISRVIYKGVIKKIREGIYPLLIFGIYFLILNIIAIELLISLFL